MIDVGWVDRRKPNIKNTFVGLRCRLIQPTILLTLRETKSLKMAVVGIEPTHPRKWWRL